VIATKGGFDRTGPGQWVVNCRPERLRDELDGSLQRLRVERIDLYQLHRIDPDVPEAEQFDFLAEAQRAGKIRHIGVSNFNVKQLERARKAATIVSVQNRYSLADRSSEDVLAHCEKLGIAFLPWYPLGAGGTLKMARVKKIADKLKATAAQVSIAWLLAKSPVMLPIPGTGNIAHLEENVAAARLKLSKEDFAALD
jgi:aryl-alcohol dehydrogenase-like predicted oxidoreductase